MSKQITWSNVAPSGRSYNVHVKGADTKDGLGEEKRNNVMSFHQTVLAAGHGPVRTHNALSFLFDLLDIGFSVDDSLEDGTAVIGPERVMVRVTGLYAS